MLLLSAGNKKANKYLIFKFKCQSGLGNQKLNLSTVPLQSEGIKSPIESVPIVNISSQPQSQSQSQQQSQLREHRFIKAAETKSLQLLNHLNSFARGPIRSNILISWELLKLISAEQQLIPALSSWPQAKTSYTATFNQVKDSWKTGRISLRGAKERLEETTWGDVGRSLRIAAEMASVYYIGELLGMIVAIPFK